MFTVSISMSQPALSINMQLLQRAMDALWGKKVFIPFYSKKNVNPKLGASWTLTIAGDDYATNIKSVMALALWRLAFK